MRLMLDKVWSLLEKANGMSWYIQIRRKYNILQTNPTFIREYHDFGRNLMGKML